MRSGTPRPPKNISRDRSEVFEHFGFEAGGGHVGQHQAQFDASAGQSLDLGRLRPPVKFPHAALALSIGRRYRWCANWLYLARRAGISSLKL
jgi:hypothetical protein